MVYTKTEEQVALMKEAALLVSKTLSQVATQLKPGMTTLDIDQFCMQYVKDHKATLSFHNYHGYPHHICASVNDVVVHGFPNKIPLKEGDIVQVKYVGDDPKTKKIKLSRKALLPKPETETEK